MRPDGNWRGWRGSGETQTRQTSGETITTDQTRRYSTWRQQPIHTRESLQHATTERARSLLLNSLETVPSTATAQRHGFTTESVRSDIKFDFNRDASETLRFQKTLSKPARWRPCKGGHLGRPFTVLRSGERIHTVKRAHDAA